MNIVLMGYRGSGKTTVGRKLADELWKTFVDTDDAVRAKFGGRTIKDIWETDGEAAFREVEAQAVAEALTRDEQVIALGGGAVMHPVAQAAIKAAKDTIRLYLKCDVQVLFERISADPDTGATRPALSPAGGTLDEIRAVLAAREPVYESLANKTFDVSLVTPTDAVHHIIRRCL